jgi:NitT/TauT family transport system permease protein
MGAALAQEEGARMINSIAAKYKQYTNALDILLVTSFLIIVWQFFYEIGGSLALAPPVPATVNAYHMLATMSFWVSAQNTISAFALAVLMEIFVGVALGIILGLNRLTGDVVEPFLTSLYSIPKLMFFPMITLFFGIGLISEVCFGILQGIPSIILFTMSAVKNIKPVYVKTGKAMRLSPLQMMLTVALPGAFPEIFTGLRIGISSTLIGVIVCEMFGSSAGLGFMLMNAMQNNIVVDLSSLTLILILFSIVLSSVMILIDKRLHHDS